jgi:hypothetical protein
MPRALGDIWQRVSADSHVWVCNLRFDLAAALAVPWYGLRLGHRSTHFPSRFL